MKILDSMIVGCFALAFAKCILTITEKWASRTDDPIFLFPCALAFLIMLYAYGRGTIAFIQLAFEEAKRTR